MTRKTKVLFGRFINSINIFNLPKTLKSFEEFDKITTFRLINVFIVAFGFNMFIPVLTKLQGQLMLAYIIALFSIAHTLAVKSNEIFVHSFSMDKLFKMTVVWHIFYIISTGLYFWNPSIMIYVDSIFSLIEVAVISSYNITLNNHITKYYPKSMSKFQIVRNSAWADGSLIGLLLSTITLYFLPLCYTVGVFILVNTVFAFWLLKNWNFYNKMMNENNKLLH